MKFILLTIDGSILILIEIIEPRVAKSFFCCVSLAFIVFKHVLSNYTQMYSIQLTNQFRGHLPPSMSSLAIVWANWERCWSSPSTW